MFDIRLLFVALAWGINFSVVKFSLAEFEPLAFTVVRFFLAALFLIAVMRAGKVSFYLERRDLFGVMLLGFLGITVYNIFFMEGLRFTTAANSALLVSLSPLAGALLQAARGKERLSALMAAGLCLATLGVVLVIRSHHDAFTFSSAGLKGDVLTLGATLSWALYTMQAKPLLERYPAVTVTAYSMLAGSALLLPLSIHELSRQRWAAVSLLSWSAMGFAAFIAAGLAYVLWYQGVKRLGVTRTMAYHYVMPVAAVLFAAVAFGEKITLLQLTGGAAILLGVYLIQHKNAE